MKKKMISVIMIILFTLSICNYKLMEFSPSENSIVKTASTSVSGDDYLKRVIIVNQSFETYFDDFLYCAAIPAAIHWEGESKHESLLVQDRDTRMVNNLYSDWDGYLDKVGGCQHVDYIGMIDDDRKTEINGYYDNPSDIQQVTSSQNIYEAANDIATYYWNSERDMPIDTAVLSYVPEEDGGMEKDEVISGVTSGINKWTIPVNSSNIGWMDAEISWDDITGSNYELSITDPYVFHSENYTTVASYYEEQESQTNNVILNNEGYEHIAMSPYYSGSVFTDFFNITKMEENKGMLNIMGSVTNDSFKWPEYPFADMVEYEINGVVTGQTISAILNWTNNSEQMMGLLLYEPGKSPFQDGTWDDYINYVLTYTSPLSLSSIAPVDGNYSLCVWMYTGSGTIDYELNATWGPSFDTYSDEVNWTVEQPINGTDDFSYTITQYRMPDEEAIASVMNGAVTASLLDIPLLYTSGSTMETETIAALDELNITKLIIIDPCDKINENLWSSSYDINNYSDENSVFDYIYHLGSAKTDEKDVIIPAIGGAWFSTAALVGAYHAGPVALPTGSLIKNVMARSTLEWWDQIDLYLSNSFIPTSWGPNSAPIWDTMTQISNDTFNWLESLNSSFNPTCNDSNADGVPDVGDSFDYSEDVDIIIVSPLNAIKLNFDQALIGKGSVGRFAFADPVLSGAWAARSMLYWYVGFSDTDNYANLNDEPAENDHWDNAGYTFVAYTHDDGIIDDDLGDEEDDDYPGGSVNRSYYMSDEFPQYATEYGMSNEFNTNYDEVKQMLEDGLALWVHADHGGYNNMLETGDGVLGLSNKPENPWREYMDGMSVEDPSNENGFVNPTSLNYSSGADWYYGLNNVHSTMMYFQDCQFGASRGPLFFAELGATSIVADVCSMFVETSPVYNDRLVKGLFSGYTAGAANRWALDEAGPIYSLHDPPPDDLGYSVQCIVYGDPELVLTTETLWIQTDYTVINEDTININIQIYDQSGVKTLPDTITVFIDGSTSGLTLVSNGDGSYSISTSLAQGKHVMRIEVSGNGYHGNDYDTIISKEYVINVPDTDTQPNAHFICETIMYEDKYYVFTFDGFEGNGPATFSWVFGDGSTSSEINPIHLYDNPGTYSVNLTIEDADGDIAKHSVDIEVIVNLKPTAEFTVSNSTIDVGDTVSFTFTGDWGDDPMTFTWGFGDGCTSAEENPTHTYDSSGIYDVWLLVQDISGDSIGDIKYNFIIVNDIPSITHPDDISYVIGNIGNEISWTVTGTMSGNCEYIVVKDGVTYTTGNWSSGIPFEINVDDLETGTYSFIIFIHDGNGGFIWDKVLVEVKPMFPATPYIIAAMMVALVGVGVIINKKVKR